MRRRKEGRFHASVVVEETSKKYVPEEKETRMEYYLVSTLYGSLIMGEDTWMIENGASKHMSGFKGAISNLKEKQFACMVELGDNSTYSIQGVGSTSLGSYYYCTRVWGTHLEVIYHLKHVHA